MGLGDICCLIASTFPKLVCTLLLVWSYYTVIFKVNLVLVHCRAWQIIIFTATTLLFAFSVTLYYLVIAVGPGSPLDFASLCRFDFKEGDRIDPPPLLINRSVMVKQNGGYRFCNKCKVWKPDRCHHCSSCNKCILRMDHHCPWFANCIGFSNYKFFLQFLIYSSLYILLVALITGWANYGFFVSESLSMDLFSFHVLFVFALSIVFQLCLVVFTLFTAYHLLKNKTTIESYESQRYRSNN
ncbi:DEKNAAC103255, partial [Brettanomyces naardenensis]